MDSTQAAHYAQQLTEMLGLAAPPLAIAFSQQAPANVAPYQAEQPAPTEDGRTGKVPAGCVFWMKAADASFTTTAEDHGNCSVGSLTHGFKTLEEAATKSDVAALVQAEWVSPEVFPHIPVVTEKPRFVSYGPLAEGRIAPDVVFLRINGKQAMMLSDAVDDIAFEGKPQCHIIPIAKEQNKTAISVGCMLSRVRTGMTNNEMTCAIPAARLAEVVANLQKAINADKTVARYASEDARRFQT